MKRLRLENLKSAGSWKCKLLRHGKDVALGSSSQLGNCPLLSLLLGSLIGGGPKELTQIVVRLKIIYPLGDLVKESQDLVCIPILISQL